MSGLFRYNSNVTPNRRTALSPFCVTQDATMESSFAFGYRSPSCSNLHTGTSGGNGGGNGGGLSPSHGLSLREFDEKLRALQKENFNLKFRVYYLESSIGGNGAGGSTKQDEDSLFKQNIDLKVEIEELRKELQVKQGLLCQAAKAMELMESEQRKQEDMNSQSKANLEQKIQSLEIEIRSSSKSNSMQSTTQNATVDTNTNSFADIAEIEYELKSKINSLEEIIKSNESTMENLVKELREAQQKLAENAKVMESREQKTKQMESRLANIDSVVRDDEENFPSISDNVPELKDQLYNQRQKLADKLCAIQDLEEKLATKTRNHDKACKTIQLLLIKTRDLDATIDELKSKESSNPVESSEIQRLKDELRKSQNDAEQAHRWRAECAEVCSILTSRLNELAGFLDSLLKHKDVLSVLAQDRHKAMRKAVDNSLDLSRSLSMSSQGRLSLNEQSFISDVLKDSFFAGRFSFDETDRRNSLLIENLRTEVQTLKSELDRMKLETSSVDMRRERNVVRHLPQVNELNSDSEEWSEPDRQVSHERIGLDESIKMNAHMRSPATKYKSVASSSASEDPNDSRLARKNSVLRFQERILDLESQLIVKHTELTDMQASRDSLQEQIDHLNADIDNMERMHKDEIDELIDRETEKLELLREQLTMQFDKDLNDKIKAEKEHIMRHHVPRPEFDELSHQYEELEKRLIDSENLLQLMRDNENETKQLISEKEQMIRDLKRVADEATLSISKVVLERTKFMNERDHLEKLSREMKEKYDTLATESSELHSKLAKLSHDNAQLHNKLVFNETQFQLTRSASQGNARYALSSQKSNIGYGASSSGDQSGYTSDETRQRLENSSPDLGIDSDGTGRSSGTDGNPSHSINSKISRTNKTELNDSFTNILLECDEDSEHLGTGLTPHKSSPKPLAIQHDCEKIDKENAELRRKLERTRRAFEKTWAQLRISNQRKEQIEKDIRQEIYKTHSVLKNVRSNIENVNNRVNTVNPLSKSASTPIQHE